MTAKVSAWKRALSQAYVGRAAVEWMSIAMWSETVHRVDLDYVKRTGIGVISVGIEPGSVEVLLEPSNGVDDFVMVNPRVSDRIRQDVGFREKADVATA